MTFTRQLKMNSINYGTFVSDFTSSDKFERRERGGNPD